MAQEVRFLFLSFLDKASDDPVNEVHSETGMFTDLLNSLFKYNGTTHTRVTIGHCGMCILQLLIVFQVLHSCLLDFYVREGLPARFSKLIAVLRLQTCLHSAAVVTAGLCSLFIHILTWPSCGKVSNY